MKKDTSLLLTTSFLFALTLSIFKIKPLISLDFIITLFSGFILLSLFSFAFYKIDLSGKYSDSESNILLPDELGITLFQKLSYWPISGKKRVALCIMIQVVLTSIVYLYF